MSEWKTKSLLEFKPSATVVWRAQISTSPDGKKFAGVRKFAIKKDGTEQITKDGISFPYDASSLTENIDGVIGLLQKLRGGQVSTESATEQYYFKSVTGKYVKAVAVSTDPDVTEARIKVTVKRSEAQLFTKERKLEIKKHLGERYKAFLYKGDKQ